MDEQSTIPPEWADGDPRGLPDRLLALLKLSIPGYRLIEEISRGGQGIVYRAVQERTDRVVAVKVLRDGAMACESARQRMQRERSILAVLDLPSVANVIDSGQGADGHEYLVMNFVTGRRLGDVMEEEFARQSAGDSAAVLLPLFVKICHAVHEVHSKGVVHCDLSPSNILIDERMEPHLLDFGLARTPFDRCNSTDGKQPTETGQFLEKPAYASPEQVRGWPDPIDPRTDVYSLGVILYQMVCRGRFPYLLDGDPANLLYAIVHTPPAALSEIQSDGRWLAIEAIVLKSLAKERSHRHASAYDLASEIEQTLRRQQMEKTDVNRGSRGGGWFDRLVRYRDLIGLVVLLAISAACTVAWVVKTSKPPVQLPMRAGAMNPMAVLRPLFSDSPPQAKRIDLLKLADPVRDARHHGVWALEDGVLISQARKGNELEFPYAAPAEYDYRLTFRCEEAAPCNLQILFPAGKHQINWCVAVRDNQACGLDLVDGKDSAQNQTTRWAKNWTEKAKPQVFVAKVRKDHVDAFLNDVLIGHYQTDYHEIGLRDWVQWERPDTLGVMIGMPKVKIVGAEVVEISGTGKSLR